VFLKAGVVADLVNLAQPPADDAERAEAVFGESLPTAVRYAELLAGPGVERGLLGPGETARLWDRHLLNCAAIVGLVPAKCTVVDVGSGAGLPGIVVAMLRPSAQVTLVEPMARRVAFLEECVANLGLEKTRVVRARAEELVGQLVADVVTARAVAPLDRLATMSVGLLRPGGKMIAIKGASAEAELNKARPALARMGITDLEMASVGSAEAGANATVVTFSAPERRIGDHSGRHAAGQFAGRPGGQVGRGTAARGPGKNARPNSRRGGG
jgi:16S rRNA (guanine527-N7)-methyltransferase